MTVQLLDRSAIAPKFKFTTQQYQLMHEAGFFDDGDRLELIDGEIKIMSPIGRKHATCVARLTDLFVNRLFRKAIIWPQNSIRLKDNSEPQPDLAILKFRDDFYEAGLPTPEDILLIIEVADSSIDYDRDVKSPLYSTAGIPEMWLFDVNQKIIEAYSQPSRFGYKQIHRYNEGDTLSILAFPDIMFNWNELF